MREAKTGLFRQWEKCAGKSRWIRQIRAYLVFRGAQDLCSDNPYEISALHAESFANSQGKLVQGRRQSQWLRRLLELRRAPVNPPGDGIACVAAGAPSDIRACDRPVALTAGTFITPRTEDGANLWRVPVGGGDEIQLTGDISERSFAPGTSGVLFIQRTLNGAAIPFILLANHSIETVARLNSSLANDLALSPDERKVLFTQPPPAGMEIMFVDNFR